MLLISVAMILAFMIVAISYSYQVLLQSAASTAIKELDFAKNNIDNLLSIIENYAVILATDETIQSRLSVSEPDAQTRCSARGTGPRSDGPPVRSRCRFRSRRGGS